MQLPLRCLHRVLHFFEAVATSRTCLLIKRKHQSIPTCKWCGGGTWKPSWTASFCKRHRPLVLALVWNRNVAVFYPWPDKRPGEAMPPCMQALYGRSPLRPWLRPGRQPKKRKNQNCNLKRSAAAMWTLVTRTKPPSSVQKEYNFSTGNFPHGQTWVWSQRRPFQSNWYTLRKRLCFVSWHESNFW